MADFQELIKNFDRIRDYMRQFYLYGFKVRGDFQDKSARTYDNERRRIEGWLSGYVRSSYTSKGKQVYIHVDSKTISQNPLYAAWKSKSLTDNDVMLHFFLLDLLENRQKGTSPAEMTASALCDEISRQYGAAFDSQLVRLKLKEYENLGIFCSRREGRSLLYRLNTSHLPEDSPMWDHLMTAVEFFQEAAPLGVIGSTLLDRSKQANRLFQFKRHFIVHTLEDQILLDVLSAIKERRFITFVNKSSRSSLVTSLTGLPLKIFVSARTGRRYLCFYFPDFCRFGCARLDSIQKISLGEICEDYEWILQKLEKNKSRCWGVSFGSRNQRLQEICIKLYIDEKQEPYILNRLKREGRGGELMRIRENEYLYTGKFFDIGEMRTWVKTFTGRILDIQSTDSLSVARLQYDWNKMYEMYCKTIDPPKEKGDRHGAV